MSFLNVLVWVVSQKSQFYSSKTMICDDVMFQKAAKSDGKTCKAEVRKHICKFMKKKHGNWSPKREAELTQSKLKIYPKVWEISMRKRRKKKTEPRCPGDPRPVPGRARAQYIDRYMYIYIYIYIYICIFTLIYVRKNLHISVGLKLIDKRHEFQDRMSL